VRLATLTFVAALALLAAPRGAHAGGATVLVMPSRAGVDATAAEQAVRDDGVTVRSFAPVRDALDAAASEQRRRDAAAARTIDEQLAAAEQAYLDQRFSDMIDATEELERGAIGLLADGDHRDPLWQLAFQRGLAYLMRAGKGDAARATERFLLALAVAPDRRPPADVYGPSITAAFRDAVAERDRRAPHPVALADAPPDAKVVIDGVVVLDVARPVELRDGLHAVSVRAPGRVAAAWIADVDGATLSVSLVADHDATPAAELGPAWAAGALSADAPSTAAALVRIADEQGATAVLLFDTAAAGFRARVVTASGAGDWQAGDTPAAAVDAALAGLGPRVVDRGAGRPLWKRHWVWFTAGAVVIAAVATAVVLSSGVDEMRVHVVAR